MAIPTDQVRLLIADTDLQNEIFSTDEVQMFLDLNGGDVRLAAADALDTIATSEVLISKVIKTQDLSTDGTKVAADLRARARQLRDQVAALAAAAGSDFFFDSVDPFAGVCPPELSEYPVNGL